jgi:hypothetical protein
VRGRRVGLEDEDLHHDAAFGIGRAGERVHPARDDLFDGGDELRGSRDLKPHSRFAYPVGLAHLDHRSLGR